MSRRNNKNNPLLPSSNKNGFWNRIWKGLRGVLIGTAVTGVVLSGKEAKTSQKNNTQIAEETKDNNDLNVIKGVTIEKDKSKSIANDTKYSVENTNKIIPQHSEAKSYQSFAQTLVGVGIDNAVVSPDLKNRQNLRKILNVYNKKYGKSLSVGNLGVVKSTNEGIYWDTLNKEYNNYNKVDSYNDTYNPNFEAIKNHSDVYGLIDRTTNTLLCEVSTKYDSENYENPEDIYVNSNFIQINNSEHSYKYNSDSNHVITVDDIKNNGLTISDLKNAIEYRFNTIVNEQQNNQEKSRGN